MGTSSSELPLSSLDLLARLAAEADACDAADGWPEASWGLLKEMGALRWAAPTPYGGLGLNTRQLLKAYERLARACLTSCFLLSQRDAAIRRILASGHEPLCRELVPPLAAAELFATVGIAQVTTSRQHTAPALRARLATDQVILDGIMPWVTGAIHADHIVTGAVLEDGQQVLVAMPARLAGVTVEPPLRLMALQGSCTSRVRLDQVAVDRKWLLAGPVERAVGTDGPGGLTTSCLALAVAGEAVDFLKQEAGSRPELSGTAHTLAKQRQDLWQKLLSLAEGTPQAESTGKLRVQSNALTLQATQAALTAAKGAGFVRPHLAQRLARQAMFFLVWSCPRPAADAMLEWLSEDVCV